MTEPAANLASLLEPREQAALVRPDGSRWSYAELYDRVAKLAGGLHARDIGPGDRVVLLVPLSPELYQCLLALAWVGATTVLIDPGADAGARLARIGPTGLIGIPKAHLLRLKIPALRHLDLSLTVGGWAPLASRIETLDGPPPPMCADPGPALLTFTSGTTGAAKAMARSHARLLAQHHALQDHLDVGPTDVDLPTLPVFSLHSLAGGATCVLPDADLRAPGSVDPARLVAQIRTEGVTTSAGSPALFQRLADHLVETGQTLPDLRALWLGGARVPVDLVETLCQVLPEARIEIIYGSTEAEPIAFLDGRAHLHTLREGAGRGALVGRPVDSVMVRLDDDEVQVAGDHVNPGYVDDPEADAAHKVHERTPEGEVRTWHRTGDCGFLDEDGMLWLLGRVGERVAGHWPHPTEAAAEALPFVRKAGLVEIGGAAQLAVAMFEDHPPDWSEQVRAVCGVAPVQVAEVPVDSRHNAKVDRPALVALLNAGSG